MFGSLIFIAPEPILEDIRHLVDDDKEFLADRVQDLKGPWEFNQGDSSIIYQMEFNDDQWLNIDELFDELERNHIFVQDIIHGLCDKSDMIGIDVISISGDYDCNDAYHDKHQYIEDFGIYGSIEVDDEYIS